LEPSIDISFQISIDIPITDPLLQIAGPADQDLSHPWNTYIHWHSGVDTEPGACAADRLSPIFPCHEKFLPKWIKFSELFGKMHLHNGCKASFSGVNRGPKNGSIPKNIKKSYNIHFQYIRNFQNSPSF
jgi:hypothetical protein